MAIRVEIKAGSLNEEQHDVIIGGKIVKALKASGIPVEASAFVLRSVKRGVLSYWRGEARQHIYCWRETEADNSHEGFSRSVVGDGVIVFKNGHHDDEL